MKQIKTILGFLVLVAACAAAIAFTFGDGRDRALLTEAMQAESSEEAGEDISAEEAEVEEETEETKSEEEIETESSEEPEEEVEEENVPIPEASREEATAAAIPEELRGLTANGSYGFQAVLPSYTAPYWQAVLRGMDQAAAELGVQYQATAPETAGEEDDAPSLAEVMQAAVESTPRAIGLGATEAGSLTGSLQVCRGQNIPVVAIGADVSGAPEGTVTCVIRTDAYAAGALAAEKMIAEIGNGLPTSSVFGILQEDDAESANCAAGFTDKMRELVGRNVQIETAEGVDAAGSLLAKEKIRGIFATGVATSEALAAAGSSSDTLVLVGRGATDAVQNAVSTGKLRGAVTESPLLLGYYTVYTMTALANGKAVPSRILIESCWYTASTMRDAAIAPNLYPR